MTSLSTPTWNHGWLRYAFSCQHAQYPKSCLKKITIETTPCKIYHCIYILKNALHIFFFFFFLHKSAYVYRSVTVTKQPGPWRIPVLLLTEYLAFLHITCSVLVLSLFLRWMPHPLCPTPLPVTVSWRPPSSTTSSTSCYPRNVQIKFW